MPQIARAENRVGCVPKTPSVQTENAERLFLDLSRAVALARKVEQEGTLTVKKTELPSGLPEKHEINRVTDLLPSSFEFDSVGPYDILRIGGKEMPFLTLRGGKAGSRFFLGEARVGERFILSGYVIGEGGLVASQAGDFKLARLVTGSKASLSLLLRQNAKTGTLRLDGQKGMTFGLLSGLNLDVQGYTDAPIFVRAAGGVEFLDSSDLGLIRGTLNLVGGFDF